MRLWRQVDAIVELADWFNPGEPPEGYGHFQTPTQIRKQLERMNDMEAVAEAALQLRDALGAVRK
jgi:hypothetical protein